MKNSCLLDKDHNFYHLGVIQGMALGLPGIIIPNVSYHAVWIGNFILWAIALPIIAMAFQSRANGIENVLDHVGKTACILSCIFLGIAFLSWYELQISTAVSCLYSSEDIKLVSFYIAMVIGLLSIFGIRYIKMLSVFAFPSLTLMAIWICFSISKSPPIAIEKAISINSIFLGVTYVVFQNLPGITSLPTFFRHAKSTSHLVLGLLVMTLVCIFFQLFGVWINVGTPLNFNLLYSGSIIPYWLAVAFVMLSLFCTNSVNIYFASAGLETIANIYQTTSLKKMKNFLSFFSSEYRSGSFSFNFSCVIIGLLGAFATFLPKSFTFLEYSEELFDNILSNLGVILFFSYFMQLFWHRRHPLIQKTTSWIGWLVGSGTSIIVQKQYPMDKLDASYVGVFVTSMAFILIIFLELNFWAATRLNKY